MRALDSALSQSVSYEEYPEEHVLNRTLYLIIAEDRVM